MADHPKKHPRIKVTKDGPYVVTGNVPLAREVSVIGGDGEPARWEPGPDFPRRESYALCRCGRSENKPFCDGTHIRTGFDGTETAGRRGYLEDVERTVGPGVDLTWSPEYCIEARFCHRGEGAWGYAERSDEPEARAEAVRQSCACPSGSLVAWDKERGEAVEPELEPSVSLIENPPDGTVGPIWVKGGIPVESVDGFQYEERNRVTLCGCGKSSRKPFCDGSHLGRPDGSTEAPDPHRGKGTPGI